MNRPRSTWADWTQVLIQGILVYGAIFALSIYKGQLIEMREANKLMKTSTDAATRAAKAAEDSIVRAMQSEHLDQRAWVAPMSIEGVPVKDQPFAVKFKFTNTGKTFARHLLIGLYTQGQLPGTPEPEFANVAEGDVRRGYGTTLAPNSNVFKEIIVKDGSALNQTDVDGLNDGKSVVVFVWGKVTYDDIFGCSHWTKFCVKYMAGGRYETYGEYNDADGQECP